MRKTGIFGGTFNPIHYGHLKISGAAYEAFDLDRVIMIPSGFSYFKAGQNIPEGSMRYEMCRLACRGFEYLEVSDIEIKREGNSYTCETLTALKNELPEDDLIYILGADSLAQMKDFKNPGMIFSLAKIGVSVRDGFDENALSDIISEYERDFGADIRVFNTENINISSSMIRQRIREGLDVSGLLPDAVETYIRDKGLYLQEELS